MKGQNFASQVLSRRTFRISRKKGSDFFDHRDTLNELSSLYIISKSTIKILKSEINYVETLQFLNYKWMKIIIIIIIREL